MDEKQPRKSGDTVFSIIILSVTMETSGRIWPNFKLIQALMYVIITCKYEKDPIKRSQEKVETSFFPLKANGDFFRRSRAANSAVGVDQSVDIRPKFELIGALMHVIIACKYEKDRMKNSREKEETPFFLHYNPMGAFCCHGNQSSDPIWPKTECSLSPIQMMLQIKFGCDRPTGCRDIHV